MRLIDINSICDNNVSISLVIRKSSGVYNNNKGTSIFFKLHGKKSNGKFLYQLMVLEFQV